MYTTYAVNDYEVMSEYSYWSSYDRIALIIDVMPTCAFEPVMVPISSSNSNYTQLT
jgi:hypothetical protein